jgi:hypothetical protein
MSFKGGWWQGDYDDSAANGKNVRQALAMARGRGRAGAK